MAGMPGERNMGSKEHRGHSPESEVRGRGWFVLRVGPQSTSAADGTAQDREETGGEGERRQECSHVLKPARGEDGMGKRRDCHLRAVGTVSEAKCLKPGAGVGGVPRAGRFSS